MPGSPQTHGDASAPPPAPGSIPPAERGGSRRFPMEPGLKVNLGVTPSSACPSATVLLLVITVCVFQAALCARRLLTGSRMSTQAHTSLGGGCACAV